MDQQTIDMAVTGTDPIHLDWSAIEDHVHVPTATAAQVAVRLARLDIAEIDPAWMPLLAAAAAELASVAGISWCFSTDDPAVALLRLLGKISVTCPGASGPHTARLLTQLG